jgi:hypothetical protein
MLSKGKSNRNNNNNYNNELQRTSINDSLPTGRE